VAQLVAGLTMAKSTVAAIPASSVSIRLATPAAEARRLHERLLELLEARADAAPEEAFTEGFGTPDLTDAKAFLAGG
jgi:hypothetical protein